MTTGSITMGSQNSRYYWKTWSGADDPTHKAWNTYTAQIHSSRRTSCKHSFFPSKPPQPYINCGSYNMSSVYTDNDELELLARIARAAKGHEFNLGVFLGQSHEVVRGVEGTISAIYGAWKSLRKGDAGGAVRSLSRLVHGAEPQEYWSRASRKRGILGTVQYSRERAQAALNRQDISSAWLAMQYGWLPLLSDVKAAAEAYHSLYSTEGRRTSFTVQKTASVRFNSSIQPSLYTCSALKRSSSRVRVDLLAYQDPLTGLGLLDPVSVAWELVPYSFVVDWFIPIGSYFEARSQIPKLRGTFYRTRRTRVDFAFDSFTAYGSGRYGPGCTSEGSETLFTREPSSTSLTVPLPRFVGRDGLLGHSNRIKNAIALLNNIVRFKN